MSASTRRQLAFVGLTVCLSLLFYGFAALVGSCAAQSQTEAEETDSLDKAQVPQQIPVVADTPEIADSLFRKAREEEAAEEEKKSGEERKEEPESERTKEKAKPESPERDTVTLTPRPEEYEWKDEGTTAPAVRDSADAGGAGSSAAS